MSNTYILMDDNNKIINIVCMPDEPVSLEIYNAIMQQNFATQAVRVKNNYNEECIVRTVTPKGSVQIGATLMENDIFLPEKPSEEYILNNDNTAWVLPFSMQTFDEVFDPVLDHEENYWI